MTELIMPIIRHLLTVGGTALATDGYISSGDVQQGVGAVIVLLGIALSAFNAKRQKDKK